MCRGPRRNPHERRERRGAALVRLGRLRRPGATPRTTLALALALLALASGACTPMDDAMAAIFGRSMRDQRSFDPYENTLMPPEGSVPLSAGNYAAGHFDVNVGQPEGATDVPPPFTQEDMTQRPEVVDSLTNPVPVTPESLARGEQIYKRVCIVCHGPDGNGANAYIVSVHPALLAQNLGNELSIGRSDGYIYGMIRVGRAVMPGYGHQIGHYDRWHVVNYVRQLQGQLPEPGEEQEPGESPSGPQAGPPDANGAGR